MEVQEIEHVTVVTLAREELQDQWHVNLTRDNLYLLVHAGRRNLVLDLRNVEFLGSSAALSLFIMLQKKLRAGGGVLALRNLTPEVRQVLELTRLTDILDIRAGDAPTN